MTWHPRLLAEQTGRTFVVTGANSGIGLEAARELVGRGAHVVLAVRDTAKGEQAAARVAGPGSTSIVELDLSDLDQVAGCATTLLDRYDNLCALICNAGVMGGPLRLTQQGFERQMATNHLGHATLVAADDPGATAHPAPYDGRQVYRNTKQANLLFAQELHRRCGTAGSPVSAVAVHPGASATNLFARQLEQAGRGRLATASKVVTRVLLQSAAAGALPTLRALDHSTPSCAFIGPARFGQLRGRPELLDVYASAKDPATAARLWELTEQVLGKPLPVTTVVDVDDDPLIGAIALPGHGRPGWNRKRRCSRAGSRTSTRVQGPAAPREIAGSMHYVDHNARRGRGARARVTSRERRRFESASGAAAAVVVWRHSPLRHGAAAFGSSSDAAEVVLHS